MIQIYFVLLELCLYSVDFVRAGIILNVWDMEVSVTVLLLRGSLTANS